MINNKFKLGLLVSAVAFASLAHAGKSTDTLIFASDSEPDNISQYHNNLREGSILGSLIWDGLVYRHPDTGEYLPALAAGWEMVDESTVDFDIREGVKFHDGSALTADDVVFTLNFVTKPESKIITMQTVSWIKSAEKLGNYKVRLHMKAPFPPALEYLASSVPIYPKAYIEKVGLDGFSAKPIGTGPYKVISITHGVGVKFEKNSDYFKDSPQGQPQIGHLEFRIIPDAETRIAELMTGGIDWAWRVAPDQVAHLKEMPNLTLKSGETMRIAFLTLDVKGTSASNSPFKDVRVRQAVNYAIVKASIASELIGGESKPLDAACFSGQFGCDESAAVHYTYDPKKAKQLLAEAGYPDGFETDLFAYRDRDVAEAIIGNLRAVGIKANLRYLKYAALRDQQLKGQAPMSLQSWGSYSIQDASASTGSWFSGSSDDTVKDPEVVQWVTIANTSQDLNVRKDNYSKALAKISKEAYWAPLFNYSLNYAYGSDLVFKPYPDELPRFAQSKWK
jgi:peptide/nickel transport system substrate-binding protein